MLHRILHNIKDDDATFEEHTQVGENYAGGRTSEKDQRRKNHKSGKKSMGHSLKQKKIIISLLSKGKVYT